MRACTAAIAASLVLALTRPSVALTQDGPQQHDEAIALALFDPDDFVSLDARSGDRFADMPVEIASGALIGTVKMVALASDGSAARVLVGLYAGGSVWIVADALRYNRNAQILLTNLRDSELLAHRTSF